MERRGAATSALRERGAIFAYVFGSVARGESTPDSDLDVAALFPEPAPASFDVMVPERVDLLVLNDAPLEVKGKIYLDERYRIERSHREFLEALGRG